MLLASVLCLLASCVSGDVGSPFTRPGYDAGPDARPHQPNDDDAGRTDEPPLEDASTNPVDTGRGSEDAATEVDASPIPTEDASTMEPPDSGPPPAPKPPVTFDPIGGGFVSPFMLNLTAGDAGAVLHYTVDGSLPTASSPQASGPIAISATTVVRVLAVRDGISSPVENQTYFELDASVQSFSSNLPLVVVHMLGGAKPDPANRSYVGATFGLFQTDAGRAELAHAAKHTSRLGIKVRGRSTRAKEKPSYSIELWGRQQEDAPASLAGMPEDGDWVLYAPFDWDRSMMHNVFAYDLSRKIGRYAPRTQYVELFVVTGSSPVTMASYVGVYVLTERLTRSSDRIAIDELDPSDLALPRLSGGYVVKVDQPDMPAEGFSAAGLTFVYDEPDVDDITPEQKQYIADYLNACDRAVKAADGVDPTTRRHFRDLMDLPSFIDHHILSLLLKNPDAFSLSSYFHKPRDGKLVAGPLWDFDLAMGAIDPWGDRSVNPSYWGPNEQSGMFKRSFWTHLFKHPEFVTAYWTRWDELLASTFTADKFRATVDAFEAQLTEAEARNRVRWPQGAPRNDSYVAEIDALQTWLDQRLTWVSANQDVVP